MRIANHHVPRITVFLLVLEFSIAILSVYFAAMIRFADTSYPYTLPQNNFLYAAIIFALSITTCMSAIGMYNISYCNNLLNTLVRLVSALSISFVVVIFLFYLMPDLYIGRGVLILVMVVSGLLIFTARILVLKSSDAQLLKSRIVFLGCGELANECRKLAKNSTSFNQYTLVGFIPMAGEVCKVPGDEVLIKTEDLTNFVLHNHVNEIIVSVMNKRGVQFPLQELLDCKLHGIRVSDATTFIEREAYQIRVEAMQPGWLIFGEGFNQSFLRRLGKRCFDLVASALIFTLAVPTMLLATALIYAEDRGPILYRQERVGLNGATYTVLKFRSMRLDAEASGLPQWAASNDPRITRIGRVIRMLRIDELPQIFNVIMGDMSFVGPRPERPYFVNQLLNEIPYYNMRHSIKPGITGMAQVRYTYAASREDTIQKLQYDLYYVKNNSLFLDLLIMIETIQVVLFGKGAR
jgi:sugar transferase (PEP-CTERM system associated)